MNLLDFKHDTLPVRHIRPCDSNCDLILKVSGLASNEDPDSQKTIIIPTDSFIMTKAFPYFECMLREEANWEESNTFCSNDSAKRQKLDEQRISSSTRIYVYTCNNSKTSKKPFTTNLIFNFPVDYVIQFIKCVYNGTLRNNIDGENCLYFYEIANYFGSLELIDCIHDHILNRIKIYRLAVQKSNSQHDKYNDDNIIFTYDNIVRLLKFYMKDDIFNTRVKPLFLLNTMETTCTNSESELYKCFQIDNFINLMRGIHAVVIENLNQPEQDFMGMYEKYILIMDLKNEELIKYINEIPNSFMSMKEKVEFNAICISRVGNDELLPLFRAIFNNPANNKTKNLPNTSNKTPTLSSNKNQSENNLQIIDSDSDSDSKSIESESSIYLNIEAADYNESKLIYDDYDHDKDEKTQTRIRNSQSLKNFLKKFEYGSGLLCSDNHIYIGALNDRKLPNGYGIEIGKNGSIYFGTFINGDKNGVCNICYFERYKDGDTQSTTSSSYEHVIFTGGIKGDTMNGKCHVLESNPNKIEDCLYSYLNVQRKHVRGDYLAIDIEKNKLTKGRSTIEEGKAVGLFNCYYWDENKVTTEKWVDDKIKDEICLFS